MHNYWQKIINDQWANKPFAVCCLPKEDDFYFFFGDSPRELKSKEGWFWFTQPFDEEIKDQSETSKQEYLEGIEKAIQLLKDQELQKVVISKIKVLPLENDLDLKQLFDTLHALYSSAFIFVYSIIPGEVWFGATPEVLLDKKENDYHTMALAGTRLAGQANDNWGDKEINEQKVVADFLVKAIQSDSSAQFTVGATTTVQAAHLEHIITPIDFTSMKDLNYWLNELQPTPAVCGLPRNEAKNLIHRIERHSRKMYAGAVGMVNAQNAKLFVQLRCAEWNTNQNLIRIYTGGGIMHDSIPENEWIEAENKANVMLRVVSELASQRI